MAAPDESAGGRRVYRATLTRIHEHLPGTRSLFLRLPGDERLAFTPGQFVSCELPVGDAPPLVRAYSLASSPEDAELEICVDRVAGGPGSCHLFALAPGAEVAFTGPFGSFALAAAIPLLAVILATSSSSARGPAWRRSGRWCAGLWNAAARIRLPCCTARATTTS